MANEKETKRIWDKYLNGRSIKHLYEYDPREDDEERPWTVRIGYDTLYYDTEENAIGRVVEYLVMKELVRIVKEKLGENVAERLDWDDSTIGPSHCLRPYFQDEDGDELMHTEVVNEEPMTRVYAYGHSALFHSVIHAFEYFIGSL